MNATKPEIFEIVIQPLETGYKPLWLKDREPVKYGELVDLLVSTIHAQGYSAVDLETGMRRFYEGWAMQRWPVFAELQPFLDEGRKANYVPRPALPSAPAIEPDGWARKIMRDDFGQEAIKRGVALGLWEWARLNPGHYPDGALVDQLVREHAERQERIAELQRREAMTPIDSILLRVAEHNARKNEDIAREFSQPEPFDPNDPVNLLGAG